MTNERENDHESLIINEVQLLLAKKGPPWRRFLAVDGVSVAIQFLLFVGTGYYAGERTKWAQSTGEKIAFFLGICALAGIIVSYLSSIILKRLSNGESREKEN